MYMDCICGKKYTNSNKCRHFRTIHHQQYIRQIDQNFVDRLDIEMNELILTEIRRNRYYMVRGTSPINR